MTTSVSSSSRTLISAWIETIITEPAAVEFFSRTLMSAWIETVSQLAGRCEGVSHSHECVD